MSEASNGFAYNIGDLTTEQMMKDYVDLRLSQVTAPEFKNSYEELVATGDTKKLYVLPDGYIYAYFKAEIEGSLINFIDEIGYINDVRLSTSSAGQTKDAVGFVTIGIIDVSDKTNPINISISGADFSNSQSAFITYDSDYNPKTAYYISEIVEGKFANITAEVDANNLTLVIDKTSSSTGSIFRICGYGSGENIVININEQKTESTYDYAWTNTRHAFVPADYEDRIIKVEEDISGQEKRLAKLESLDIEGVPNYVLIGSETIADKVLAVRNASSFVFGGAGDLHTDGKDSSANGVLHLGMAMDKINSLTQLDLLVLFGDIIVSKFDDTYKQGFKFVKKCFYDVSKSVPFVQMQGNHDELSSDTTEEARQKYFAYIGANNVNTVTDWNNRFRNYGYKDFVDQKMRFIYLNSADVSDGEITGDVYVTIEQLRWLINVALDFSDKDDWSFVVASHHPLNWYGNISNVLTILNDYKGKMSGSITLDGSTIDYNFSNVKAEFVAHFHGHLHNFRAETLGTNNVLTITIPNGCFGRNNEYGIYDGYDDEVHTLFGDVDENGNQRQFNKIEDSLEDTAFNIIVVDRQNRKIYCFNYGAGIDRVINY